MLHRLWRLSIIISILMLLLPLLLWLLLRGSLPQLEGEKQLSGLTAPVTIERDAKGTVTINADNDLDMARALGFVHAQERFFEMDLMRRRAAGELAELFGKTALEHDIKMRKHRLRSRTHQHLAIALGDKQNVAESYRDGVNAGLAALTVRPWPYVLLRQTPRPWELEDTLLVGLAMYADLQDTENSQELALARIRKVIPESLYTLITHDGSQWDAPLFGLERGNAVLPTADQLDLRQFNSIEPANDALIIPDTNAVGSNNFAVSGALTTDGRAIVADDMHLSLRAPNIWFRARLRYNDKAAPNGKVDINGFTLPGIPAMIVGSNTHIAWGFTNSYIDTADFVHLPETTQTGNPLSVYQETITIAGKNAHNLIIQESEWGPLWHEKEHLALRWVAHLPGAINLNLADMATAQTIEAAFSVADKAGLPAQNLLVADSSGRIAWRLIGARPKRSEQCVYLGMIDLQDETNHSCLPWPLIFDQAPALIDPPLHRLWSANARIVDDKALEIVGDGGYDLGARAQQIRDRLLAHEPFNETDLLAIQLDDRALLMQRWWQLLRDTVIHSDKAELQRLEMLSRRWDGRASTDSVSYHLAREFRQITLNTLKTSLLAPAKQTLGERFIMPRLAQFEGVAWPLLEQKPVHLLPQPFQTWEDLLTKSAQKLANTLTDESNLTWGKHNTAAICHPLMRALPDAARPWLCMPPDPLPGDHNVPRVQTPNLGASQRMVVAPGHEIDGIIHMPGGQSGHFMSPFWGSGHDDWVQGKPTPFLPGETQYQLVLMPSL